MIWFKKNNYNKSITELPSIDNISVEIPAISEYLDIFRLPHIFKQAESDTLPVIDVAGNIVGIVSEYDLAKALPELNFEEENHRYNITVENIMTKNVWTEPEHASIKDLFSSVHKMHTRVIPVIDNERKYTGKSITRTALISYLTRRVKPVSPGGMATPLGVYMTDGQNNAGARGNLGIILTGATFGLVIAIIQIVTNFILNYIKINNLVIIIGQLFVFILFLRLTPFSRYHAAEHQTIHAIEKGLPLTLETVKMQPRPHKRCGTNLMILIIGIQFVILLSKYIAKLGFTAHLLFLVAGFLFVFSNWKKIGMWMQQYFTTAIANDKQIENGIEAGNELLKKHKANLNPPNIFQKVWNMGLIQVIASFLFVLWIFDNILKHL